MEIEKLEIEIIIHHTEFDLSLKEKKEEEKEEKNEKNIGRLILG